MNHWSLGLVLGGLLAASQVSHAASINITAPDPAPNGGLAGSPWGFNVGPYSTHGNDGEDNETEQSTGLAQGTVRAQIWDLEGMSVRGTGTGPKLSIVGGYSFDTVQSGYAPGELFIKVGGLAPAFTPTAPGSATTANAYGYNYAVNLITGVVHALDSASILNTVEFDALGSNPFTYSSGQTSQTTTTTSLVKGKTAAQVASITGEASFGTLRGDTDFAAPNNTEASHNIVEVDLSFLGDIGNNTVYFHYTMGCGNDVIKGQLDNGFKNVPEGGATLMLLGMGLFGTCAFRRRTAAR